MIKCKMKREKKNIYKIYIFFCMHVKSLCSVSLLFSFFLELLLFSIKLIKSDKVYYFISIILLLLLYIIFYYI